MPETFKAARDRLLVDLQRKGWELRTVNLKVPYATSPDTELRFWFKPQAIYFSTASYGGRHEFKHARSLVEDMRGETTERLIAIAERRKENPMPVPNVEKSLKRSIDWFRKQGFAMKNAYDLAQAEKWAEDQELQFDWEEDPYQHDPDFGPLVLVLRDKDGEVLDSVGGYEEEFANKSNLRRQVEAEIALNAMPANWRKPTMTTQVSAPTMRRGRQKNPDDNEIIITYRAVPNFNTNSPGWAPQIQISGENPRGGWESKGMDRDDALAAAKAMAEEAASRFTGDWDVQIRKEIPDRDKLYREMEAHRRQGLSRKRKNPESAADVIEALIDFGRQLRKPIDSKEASQIVDTMTDLELGKTLWYDERQKLTPYLYLKVLDKRLETYGIEAVFDAGNGGTTSSPVDFQDRPIAEYLNTGDTYSTTILFNYEAGKHGLFMVTTWGDFVEAWEQKHADDHKTIYLENTEDEDDDLVTAHLSGPRAAAIARHEQSIEGSHWETDGDDFAYATFLNREGLVEDLEKDGWDVNADNYSPPEEEDE